jgi:hypothetical protein
MIYRVRIDVDREHKRILVLVTLNPASLGNDYVVEEGDLQLDGALFYSIRRTLLNFRDLQYHVMLQSLSDLTSREYPTWRYIIQVKDFDGELWELSYTRPLSDTNFPVNRTSRFEREAPL